MTFTNSGEVNIRNMHYWATQKPQCSHKVDNQHSWKVNVWCIIVGSNIIESYFIDGHSMIPTTISLTNSIWSYGSYILERYDCYCGINRMAVLHTMFTKCVLLSIENSLVSGLVVSDQYILLTLSRWTSFFGVL